MLSAFGVKAGDSTGGEPAVPAQREAPAGPASGSWHHGCPLPRRHRDPEGCQQGLEALGLLVTEYRSEVMGRLLLREAREIVRSVVRGYDPIVYGRVWRWDEGIEDLVQDFCVDVLIGQGQLDYALAVAADLQHFRRLLARQLRHHLARRRQRTIVDNILERCKTLVMESPFRLVATPPAWSYTVAGKQVESGIPSAAALRDVAASLTGFPTIKSNPTMRAPMVYSTEVLVELLEGVATALPHAVTVADLDRILSFLLTSWLPRFLEQGERGDLRPAVDDLSVEERAIVAEVSGSIMSSCTGIAREVLRLKLAGASDREIGRQLGMSRPTVAKHKHRLFRRLERVLAPLAEEMRVAVVDSLGDAPWEGRKG
jgi:DNA-binding CsgD family transcriptional regulator